MRSCLGERLRVLVVVAALVTAGPLAGQGPGSLCAPPDPSSDCAIGRAAAEALGAHAAVLATGATGGLGVGGEGGLRLGALPGVTAAVRLSAAPLRLPRPDAPMEEAGGFRTAVSTAAAWRFFEGFTVAPTVAGVGAVELIGTGSLALLGSDELNIGPGTVAALGVGVRVGLVRESFTLPGASVSVAYTRVGEVTAEAGPEDRLQIEAVPEVWSTRAVVGKRIGGVGLSGGVGLDGIGGTRRYFIRPADGDASEGYINDHDSTARWSAFAGLSRPLLIGAVAAEAGWVQGGEPPAGYPVGAEFDPTRGTWFGSLGVRLAL